MIDPGEVGYPNSLGTTCRRQKLCSDMVCSGTCDSLKRCNGQIFFRRRIEDQLSSSNQKSSMSGQRRVFVIADGIAYQCCLGLLTISG